MRLEIKNLSFGYQEALGSGYTRSWSSPVSLGIWGPNGSGKSTLLKTLVGLVEPFQGQVAWKRGTRLAYVPQELDQSFQVPISVREVMTQMSAENADFESIVSSLELSDFLEQSWSTLSRGQRQRTLVGRALMKDAEVLLMDEPFSALDQRMSERLEALILDWSRERDLILIDHQRIRLERIAREIWEL